MTVAVVMDWTENAKSPSFSTVVAVKPSQSRRRTGMQPAVEVVLAGNSVKCQLTARATLETRDFRGFKASEKTGDFPV